MNVHRIDPATAVKEEGRYLRRIIRRNKGEVLTKTEVDILITYVNLWLYHRNGPKGYIHPGRKAVAKKNKASVVTVARALQAFRAMGFVLPVKYLTGGQGQSTHYKVDLDAIRDAFDPSNVVTLPGELVPFTVSNERPNDTVSAYQNDTLSIGQFGECCDRRKVGGRK